MKKEIKVLLVEDNPVDVLMITHTLEADYPSLEIVHAENKNSFVKALHQSTYDVILCDHSLKDFNSLEALAILNESKIEVPFIIVTGNNNPDLAFKAINNGAYDYVLKSDILHLTTATKNALSYFEVRNELREMKNK